MSILKSLVAAVLSFAAAVAFAAVDINKATQAELESVKGIGPAVSERILAERGKQSFADWGDLQKRVKGVGPATAAKFSAAGLTVNGSGYTPAEKPAKAPKAERAAAAAKPLSAKPQPAAVPAK